MRTSARERFNGLQPRMDSTRPNSWGALTESQTEERALGADCVAQLFQALISDHAPAYVPRSEVWDTDGELLWFRAAANEGNQSLELVV